MRGGWVSVADAVPDDGVVAAAERSTVSSRSVVAPVEVAAPAVTYAQNHEDVRLWKALGSAPERLWVDVGAGHPVEASVTRLFADRGWHGINVEPGPNFDLLARERPGDVNVRAAVWDVDGRAPFHVAQPYPDLSSLDAGALEADPDHVRSSEVVEVGTVRLDTLLAEHVGETPIGFLKVDAEGAERQVLVSNDWRRFRPAVVVVEAIAPGTRVPSHEAWEADLLGAGYLLAADDGINRFYRREDRPELHEPLAAPVSALDGFVPWSLVEARAEVDRLHAELAARAAELAAANAATARAEAEAAALVEQLTHARHAADRAVGDAVDRDRRAKEAAAALAATRAEVDRRDAANLALIAEVERWRDQALEMERSWAWRSGRWAVRAAGPVRPLAGPAADAALGAVRARRARPEVVRAEHADLTRPGRPLAHVRSIPKPALTGPADDDLARLHRALLAARPDGPRPLDADEWRMVEEVAAGVDRSSALARLVVLRRPLEQPDGAPADVLVVDVRGAQLPMACGTRTHARHVLAEALAAVPDGVRVEALADPGFPALPPELAARIDGPWRGDVGVAGALLQLAPFATAMRPADLDLHRAPWVRSASVWLDGIIATHAHAYLGDAEAFLEHQIGVECVHRHDRLLSLSSAAAVEAARVVPAGSVAVTGCRGGLVAPPSGARPDLAFTRHVVVVGNALPHKNVAAGVAGFVPAAVRDGGDLGVVVAANMTDAQHADLVELALRLGLERHRIVTRSLVPDDEFALLVATADAVVVPSFHEGFSLPVIEATGVGTPVVVSDIPAHRELLGEGPWWFDPADPVSCGEALSAVLADREGVLARQQADLSARHDADRVGEVVAAVVADLCRDLAPRPPVAPPARRPATGAMSLSKVCEVEDFAHPRLRPVIAEVFAHERLRFGPGFPDGREYRKYWEVAMAVLAFRDCGLLDGTRRFLGIGAGNEPTVFHLTRFATEVLATDLYLAEGWEESANATMLTDPAAHWPFEWRPDRLRVAHMDALDLDLPDASVAGVFSSSSVEHFGDRDAVARSLDEAYRVLEPGGVLSVSTEFRLRGDRPGIPGALLFDEDDVDDLFLGGRGWSLVEPFDPSVSAATWATDADFPEVVADQQAQVDRLGGLWTHHVTYARYPHIVLSLGDHTFTSFHLALRKHG